MKNTKKYSIILADPPWRYDFSKDNADKIENHYPTMTLENIKNLTIPSDDNSVLYLWATAPKLLEALEVMSAWGFKYTTQMVWDKEWIGMGYWFRGQHEMLLVGKKGKFSPPKTDRVSSVLRERRTAHSKKPVIIKKWINQWFPEASKIELFAREKTEGWDCVGNGINGKDIRQELEELCQG